MTTRVFSYGCAVLFASLSAGMMGSVRAQQPDLGTEAQRESGRNLYLRYCVQCHGEKGDGEGYATPHLLPKPRDFTAGKFKVRTTPSGALPTHQDLIDIIRRGMPYTSMPAWPELSNQQVSDLAYYLKTFSPDFANPNLIAQPESLESGPSATTESVDRGKTLYVDMGCVRCHGTVGRGDGASAPTLVDDWGYPIRAANLTQRWTFRGGASREDIFRTMSTGFNGTPMPSFVEGVTPEQRWAITDYIVSLGSEGPGYTNLVVARHVLDPIDLTQGAANFATAPVARLPIIGQIMEPGRAFHPATTSVTVQAIYDTETVALLVRWHDIRVDNTGQAGMSLPVPPEEEVLPKPTAAPAGATGQDPFDPFADPAATVVEAPPSEFNDAVAIQIPAQVPTGARKPYFLFGDPQNAVDLWFFDLSRREPLQFTGRGSADITPNDTGDVTGVASYDQGEWSVIFTRPLRPTSGPALSPGGFMPLAVSVWDGFSRERGNRRGLSLWYSLYLEPENVPSAFGPMLRTAFVILVIELAIIAWVRSRYRSGARDEIHPSPPQGGFGEVSPERAQ